MGKHTSALPGLGRGDKGIERSVWPRASRTRNVDAVCKRCGTEYINEAEDGLCDECWFETHVIEGDE